MPNYKIVVDPYTSNPASIFLDTVGFIPLDEANSDYQQYLAWLAEGNTPEPWEATNGPE